MRKAMRWIGAGFALVLPVAALSQQPSAEDLQRMAEMAQQMGGQQVSAEDLQRLMELGEQMQQMQSEARFADAERVHFRIVGVFDAWTEASDWARRVDKESGEIDARDTVTLEFDWDVRNEQIIGEARIENSATTVSGTRNTFDERVAPQLKGDYDHLEVTAVRNEGTRLVLEGHRNYPAMMLALNYPSSLAMQPVDPERLDVIEYSAVPEVGVMDAAAFMPVDDGSALSVTADRKSAIVRANNWTWTFTPTVIE